ncbi:MAG: acetolactate synthase small subunit [Elusimicrobia bacterium]|nr:acetolactate synthase small subunit [Candidatus Obscuribacterium magneticum]
MVDNTPDQEQSHVISVLVENKAGVLARIAGLFSARGYNIDSLAVGTTDDPQMSRMTIVVKGDERVLEQVEKQLNKLVDVIKVMDYAKTPHIERDLMLVKVAADKENRSEIIQMCDVFRANIVDAGTDSIIIEVTGDDDKLEAFLNMVRPFGIRESVRTGVVAMARGGKAVNIPETEKITS